MRKFLTLLLICCLMLTTTACAAPAEPEAGASGSPATMSLAATPAADGFSDVPEGAWYADAVYDLRGRGVMVGTSDTEFSPDIELSRAMAVTVLWRLAGEPAPASAPAFSDVAAGTWYTDAVAWAAENGVVEGYGNGRFGPNDPVTREQLAVLLWRSAGSPESGAAQNVTVSGWAENAVGWAQGSGIFDGVGNDLQDMTAPATRAEAAVMLYNYLKLTAGTQIDVIVGETVLTATLADNDSAKAFAELLAAGPVTVQMHDYGGFEKVGDLPKSLVRSDEAITTVPGDIILYQGNQITVYYAENTWDFTRLGRIEGVTQAELKSILGDGDVIVTFRLHEKTPDTAKMLIAYFSCTGNTESVAGHIAALKGGELYAIEPETPYTAADLNYRDSNSRSTREMNDPDARPAIGGEAIDMADYDVIFLGYPIWHGQAPRIISTFMESHDFAGKTIVPFCTSGSSGIGSSASNLNSLCPGAEWLNGERFAGSASENDVKAWLDTLELPTTATHLPYDGVYPQHEPYGVGVGAMPGRVTWVHDTESVNWDGGGWWWEPSNYDEAVILQMVNDGIASLGGEADAKSGWAVLFEAHNGGDGYSSGEKIAIKANINGSGVNSDYSSGETRMSYTNPVLLKALLTSLVTEAGVAPEDITVYDVSRIFPDYMVELCRQGELRGVNFEGRNNGTADEAHPIEWSYSFSGKVNYLPTCVIEAAYVINLANLKGHSYGITLCGKNHFGSFINGNAMRPPEGANLHQWLTKNEMGIYSPLVDLMANEQLGGKTVLYMLDALICAVSEGSSMTGDNTKWRQAPFNGDYTQSIFLSQDPVAIDSVGADFLISEPTVTENNGAVRNNPSVENYLHEAGLVYDAPSGVAYTDGVGGAVINLGVHEHWNNSTEKLYSRNLGKSEGIELILVGE